ncbi:MAG: thioesterase, partial [Oscillospiraceae bacterium]
IVVNPISRKIIRPAAFPWQMPQVTDRVVSALPIGKIFGENAKKIGEHLVKIPELDANGHVYNANYGDIAVEFLTTQMYEQDVENFRINFVNEAKLGDLIDIYLAEDEGKAIVFGKCGEKICFETEFIWKK